MATPAQGLTLVSTQEILEALIKLPEYVPPHNSLAYGLMPDGTPYAAASRADQLDAIHKALASVYTYEAVAGAVRPVSVSAPCAQCGSTSASTAYTSAGDVARRVEHEGRITFYTYDTKGRETERATYPAAYNTATARPALNLAERVVSTKWHSTWNLPTQVAEPQKVTAYTYGTGGRLCGESWTATTDATGRRSLRR